MSRNATWYYSIWSANSAPSNAQNQRPKSGEIFLTQNRKANAPKDR